MSNRTRSLTSKLCLTIAAMLGAATVGGVCAAADAPAATAASAPATAQQPLQQLDEIWVHGKRLARAITDAEDDVLVLYNKLNKEYKYGVTCGYASISRGSMITQRACMPNFIADSSRNSYPVTDYGGGGSMCYGGGGRDMNGQGYYSASYCQSSPAPVQFVSPPIDALMMEHHKAYEANVVKVINSDPQLLQKYRYLVGLRAEMNATQQRYVQARQNYNAQIKPAKGPRAP